MYSFFKIGLSCLFFLGVSGALLGVDSEGVLPACKTSIKKLADEDPVEDYRALVQALDWNVFLSQSDRESSQPPLQILDIGCGTGRWLLALQGYNDLSQCPQLYYHCIDPSKIAVQQAMSRLQAPFSGGTSYATTIQEAELPLQFYDLMWSLHGLYSLKKEEVHFVLDKCYQSLKPGGHAVIALASQQSFYFDCYQQFRKHFSFLGVEQYCSAEDLLNEIEALGFSYSTHTLSYTESIPAHQFNRLDHFIMRECIGYSFNRDEDCTQGFGLAQLLENSEMNSFIESKHQGSQYLFPQVVCLIDIHKK